MDWFKKLFQSKGKAPEALIKPPFPALIRDAFGDGDLFYWTGKVHLESWKGFATDHVLNPDGWYPPNPHPDGDLKLSVEPADTGASSEPTEAQSKAFQHLLDNEKAMRETVLQGIFEVYPAWRESYFGNQMSSDGGKTYQPASAFPDIFPPENMPEILNARDLVRLIRPQTIHILKDSREGFAEVGFAFDCKWDEEHGLGVLTHKGKVVQVGDGTASFEHQ